MAILGLLCTAEVVEDGCFNCRRLVSGVRRRERKIDSDLGSVREGYFIARTQKGNTYYWPISLVTHRRLMLHLLSSLAPTRVAGS